MSRIFGPVPSRRLGRSLGVDVVPYKTCTFDCVYCECGATTELTCERREFFPLEEILDELRDSLAEITDPPDVITLSGAGEPTLYSRLGELIDGIKRSTGIPVAVITNSSLLFMPDVRDELDRADIVLPSLDSTLAGSFSRLNRPHPEITIEGMIDGLGTFLDGYTGKVLFEILLVEGYNTGEEDLETLGAFIRKHRVDSIQLNTAVRPGTESRISPLSHKRLESIRDLFGPGCEIVASVGTRTHHEDFASADRILSMIERRPCTAADIHRALGVPIQGVIKLLGIMIEDGSVGSDVHDGETFYTASERNSG
ncbi:MAG: radical SAM protein [Candidatus Krumholzibacteria bacterium]|nr:radical SAM protein [Candidatus Krumholzibacteria bacterium]